jgi:hypothetical protein
MVDYNASCPFATDVCRSNTSNIALDTGYVDSHFGFGLNAPHEQRFVLRYKLHCAPLQTDGYTGQLSKDNQTYVTYRYGGLVDGTTENITVDDYTYVITEVESQYRRLEADKAGLNLKL